MALNLARADVPLVVWNRTPGRLEPLLAAGAEAAESVDDVLARTSTVLFMMANGHVLDEVLGRGTAEFGRRVASHLVVHMGTTSAEYSRALAADVRAAGGRYVEAPVSGSRGPAEAAQLVGMLAGAPEDVEVVRPLVAATCRETFDCGEVPAALMTKLSVNLFLITTVVGLAESAHFAERHGVDMATFRAVIDAGQMSSTISRAKLQMLVSGEYPVAAAREPPTFCAEWWLEHPECLFSPAQPTTRRGRRRALVSLRTVLLALDTATPAVTVALADGERVLAERTTVDARRHGELLAPAIAEVLAEAGVDRTALTAVGVGTGPGPFTGLRVGLVTARTLGAVLSIPVLGVCTLDTLALAAGLDEEFRVVTDARRKEVHWAAYRPRPAGPERVDGPYVAAPADAAWDGPTVGAGAELYADAFPGHRAPLHPSAADLARWVARGLPTSEPDPLYLRRPDAAEPGARKSVLTNPPA